MMISDDKVGGWVKKGQNHDDVILEWPLFETCRSNTDLLPNCKEHFAQNNSCLISLVGSDSTFVLVHVEFPSMFLSALAFALATKEVDCKLSSFCWNMSFST